MCYYFNWYSPALLISTNFFFKRCRTASHVSVIMCHNMQIKIEAFVFLILIPQFYLSPEAFYVSFCRDPWMCPCL